MAARIHSQNAAAENARRSFASDLSPGSLCKGERIQKNIICGEYKNLQGEFFLYHRIHGSLRGGGLVSEAQYISGLKDPAIKGLWAHADRL